MPSDVIVIGAGIIGGSIAWRLAQCGLRVALLDAGVMGEEASWAGAGMLAPGGEIQGRSPWSEYGLESLSLYPHFVNELREETGIKIEYRPCGAIEIAGDVLEWESIASRALAQQALGIASEELDQHQVREAALLVAPDVQRAMFYPGDALVDPRDIMKALRVACTGREVEIIEHQRAIAVESSQAGVEVETTKDHLASGVAVLAAGAWSGQIAIRQDGSRLAVPETFPVRGHLLGYQLACDSIGPIVRRGNNYIVQRAGGFTIAGTSTERAGFDRRIDSAVAGEIAARAAELVPALAAAGEPQPWIGFRPATPDETPVVGRMPGANVWLAYGHYRNGILLAPVTARMVATEITASWERDPLSPGVPL